MRRVSLVNVHEARLGTNRHYWKNVVSHHTNRIESITSCLINRTFYDIDEDLVLMFVESLPDSDGVRDVDLDKYGKYSSNLIRF